MSKGISFQSNPGTLEEDKRRRLLNYLKKLDELEERLIDLEAPA